ncbi:MAG: DNA-binding domain protein, partial [Haloplasmataceae bacterium]|nr:DNA-binding domain protein [Haloplasmataceae bacterium]
MTNFLYHIKFLITDKDFNIWILLSQDDLFLPVYIRSYDLKIISKEKYFKMVYDEIKEYLYNTKIAISKDDLLLLHKKLVAYNLPLPSIISVKLEEQIMDLDNYNNKLTTKEILFLMYIDGKEVNDKSLKTWEEENKLNVTYLIDSLLDAYYISTDNYKFSLSNAKRSLLLSVVEKYHLDVRGDNKDLINKIKSELTEEQLKLHFSGTHYSLTDKGKEVAKSNSNLADFNRSSFHFVENMRNEEFHLLSIKKPDYNFQAISRLLLPKANATLTKFMNWNELINNVMNPPKQVENIEIKEVKSDIKKSEDNKSENNESRNNNQNNHNFTTSNQLSNILSKVRVSFINEHLNNNSQETQTIVDQKNQDTQSKNTPDHGVNSITKNETRVSETIKTQSQLSQNKISQQPNNKVNEVNKNLNNTTQVNKSTPHTEIKVNNVNNNQSGINESVKTNVGTNNTTPVNKTTPLNGYKINDVNNNQSRISESLNTNLNNTTQVNKSTPQTEKINNVNNNQSGINESVKTSSNNVPQIDNRVTDVNSFHNHFSESHVNKTTPHIDNRVTDVNNNLIRSSESTRPIYSLHNTSLVNKTIPHIENKVTDVNNNQSRTSDLVKTINNSSPVNKNIERTEKIIGNVIINTQTRNNEAISSNLTNTSPINKTSAQPESFIGNVNVSNTQSRLSESVKPNLNNFTHVNKTTIESESIVGNINVNNAQSHISEAVRPNLGI